MSAFTGTGGLVRLALRRDRILLPVWTVIFLLTASSTASSTKSLYPTVKDRVELASSTNDNTSLVAIYGRVYDTTSLGGATLLKLMILGSIMAAILSIIIVVRHTRTEEESGRLELVGSTAIGRRAPLTAALVIMVATNLVIGLFAALGLVGAGLSAGGSFASGLAWASVGIAFGAIAAVVAQLTETGRAAIGYSSAVLGGFFLVRAIGDTSSEDGPRWLSWLSPFGWAQQFRPFAGDRWWVALIALAFAAVAAAGAYVLVARRDLGAGILPDRPGRATASASLSGPLGLAWRLNRGVVIGWTIAAFVGGLLFGGIASNVGDLAGSSQSRDFITKLGGASGLTDAFLGTELGFVGVFSSILGVSVAMRMRTEETTGRAEPVLATAVSRLRWASGFLTVALAGIVLILLAVGLGAGLTFGGAQHDVGGQVGRLLGAALVQIPAAWVIVSIVVLAFGFVPRFVVAGWAFLVAFLLLGELGPAFDLPQGVMDVSPFAHTPRLPGAEMTYTPIIWLLVVALGLGAVGLYGFRRRDITS
ncbi:ABC transporter permease [Actinomadura barringtoniae]|uniref:ABC transporter permease n=1 Tax=Actinomadura barringtoniae TaxID=1427535 RepID=A0A939PGM5_9ACTN|nr:ABC transporter permease [Actinomadura barringtoniae]MBO2449399.1 ABC transporter permease [Actinomadura barringtoniae]